MPLNILSRPANLTFSKNDITYTIRREDYPVDSINITTNEITINLSAGDITAEFTQNNKIFVSTEGINAKVNTVSFDGTNTKIIVFDDLEETGSGYINLISGRSDYRMLVTLFDLNDEFLLSERLEYQPFPNGNMIINLSDAVTSLFKPRLDPDISTVGVFEQLKKHQSFYPKFTEKYNNLNGDNIVDSANPKAAFYGQTQVNESNYPAATDYNCTTSSAGNILTRLEDGFIYNGYPNTVGFYLGESVAVTARERGYDINKANPVINEVALGTLNIGLQYYSFKGDNTYSWQSIQFYSGATPISNEVFFLVKTCDEDFVFVEFLNDLGGVSNIGFDYNGTIQEEYQEAIIYENYTSLRDSRRITKGEYSLAISVSSQPLSRIQAFEIGQLKGSPSINIVNSFSDRVSCVPEDFNTPSQLNAKGFELFFTLRLPRDFNPFLTTQPLFV